MHIWRGPGDAGDVEGGQMILGILKGSIMDSGG